MSLGRLNNSNQKGNALLLSVFIMLVMMLLGTALVRILSAGSESISYEVLGTRAYSAAQSGLELKLAEAFPLNQEYDLNACDDNLPLTISTNDFTGSSSSGVKGLFNCSVSYTCHRFAKDIDIDGKEYQFFRIVSTGECGLGSDVPVSRTLQVEARSL